MLIVLNNETTTQSNDNSQSSSLVSLSTKWTPEDNLKEAAYEFMTPITIATTVIQYWRRVIDYNSIK